MCGGQLPQFGDDLVGPRDQHPIAADQVGVVVDEPCPFAFEAADGVQVEEDGAAAEKRLDVAVEGDRIESA